MAIRNGERLAFVEKINDMMTRKHLKAFHKTGTCKQ